MRTPRLARPLTRLAAVILLGCSGDPPPQAETPPESAPPPPAPQRPLGGPGGELQVQEPARPDPAQATRGIDVSVHSGAVDWTRVAGQGVHFAFVKATEGVDLADGAFQDHWPAVKEAGLIRGAYHFYVTEDDPQEQARFFIANVVLEPGDLAPVVDVEVLGHGTQPGLADRLRTFIGIVEEHYGVRPIIYTSPKFWDQHLDDTFGGYPLWIAEYGVEAPTVPAGWETWTLWQWMGDADVKGVEKGADLSRAHPELADAHLEALVVGRALTRSRPLM
ncbi:MAG TPA: GH25 family lysozyme [Thermoanaerobaculia bacterium]